MKKGDYVIKPTSENRATIWRVTGVYLGATGHQDVVGLAAMNRKPASAHGEECDEMLVPIELVMPYLASAE